MTFSQSISSVFSKYATFSGRASRSEYWYFVLFNFIISSVISAIAFAQIPIDTIVMNNPTEFYLSLWQAMPLWISTVMSLYSLAVVLPSLAVSVRRLHDTGRGGGWIFINMVPVIGPIWFLILTVLPSQNGDNRFGSQPE